MKKISCLLFSLIAITVLCLSGCSDFGFNPIGTWHLTERKTYDSKDNVISIITPDEEPLMKSTSLTFKKSGTGYIGGAHVVQNYTYEYTDSTVTISYTDKSGQDISVDYEVRNNGKALVRTHEYSTTDEKGNKTQFREELIFTK